MNNRQKRKIENLTRILSKQDSGTVFQVSKIADQLVIWADNQQTSQLFDRLRMFQAVIGVKGGVKVITKQNFYI